MFDSEMIDLEMLHLEMFDLKMIDLEMLHLEMENALHLIIGERDPGATFMRARTRTYMLIGYSQSTHAQGIALRVLCNYPQT